MVYFSVNIVELKASQFRLIFAENLIKKVWIKIEYILKPMAAR